MDASASTPDPTDPPAQGGTVAEHIGAIGGPLVVLAIVAGTWAVNLLGIGDPKLEIVSAASADSLADPVGWQVAGRVILRADGRPMVARVWAVAVDSVGNRFSPPEETTDPAGRFALPTIPFHLTADTAVKITDITVTAVGRAPGDTARFVRGDQNLRLTRAGGVRWVEPSPVAMISLGLLFVMAVLIGLVQLKPAAIIRKRAKYYSLVVLTFLFTFSMVGVIAAGLRSVNATASPGDVISLGFANIYQGTYVKDQPAEWLLSLTAPPRAATGDEPTTGFGAPLWLLLIAVLGSAVFTIALLVKHVKDSVKFDDEVEFRSRIEELVRHQFYVLFSPLGGVLVYQLLVAAGAGSVQATVAMTIFAAGAAVNLLLDKALRTIQDLLQ